MASMFALANPKRFMDMSEKLLPWLSGAAALALVAGFVLGFLAPPDYQQGTTVKIMFLHVPAAWTAMMAYGLMRSEERRVGKSVDLGGRRIIKKKKRKTRRRVIRRICR